MRLLPLVFTTILVSSSLSACDSGLIALKNDSSQLAHVDISYTNDVKPQGSVVSFNLHGGEGINFWNRTTVLKGLQIKFADGKQNIYTEDDLVNAANGVTAGHFIEWDFREDQIIPKK
jgi:hypothetical protein